MRARAIWVPGNILGTNRLLDLCRSSGFYDGVARAMRERRKPARFGYAQEVRRLREHTAAQALAAGFGWEPLTRPVGLWFGLLGSGRLDPSAWYLAAKAAEDGLCDAGVIRSDRSDVLWTGGRCFKSRAEGRAAIERHGYQDTRDGGLLIELCEGEGAPDAA